MSTLIAIKFKPPYPTDISGFYKIHLINLTSEMFFTIQLHYSLIINEYPASKDSPAGKERIPSLSFKSPVKSIKSA